MDTLEELQTKLKLLENEKNDLQEKYESLLQNTYSILNLFNLKIQSLDYVSPRISITNKDIL